MRYQTENDDFLRRLLNLDLFAFPNLTETQRKHIVSVYNYLLGGILLTAGGAAGGIALVNNGVIGAGALGNIGALGSIASVVALAVENATNIGGTQKGTTTTQVAAFGALSLSNGLILVAALMWAMFMNVQILVTAFMGSVAIFASLSMAALLARSGAFFWLGSVAASLTSYMLMTSLLQLFVPSAFGHSPFAYLGIATTLLYILFDTQFIVEAAGRGNRNVISHALQIYMDFISLFMRLLHLLTRQEEDRKYGKKRR